MLDYLKTHHLGVLLQMNSNKILIQHNHEILNWLSGVQFPVLGILGICPGSFPTSTTFIRSGLPTTSDMHVDGSGDHSVIYFNQTRPYSVDNISIVCFLSYFMVGQWPHP